ESLAIDVALIKDYLRFADALGQSDRPRLSFIVEGKRAEVSLRRFQSSGPVCFRSQSDANLFGRSLSQHELFCLCYEAPLFHLHYMLAFWHFDLDRHLVRWTGERDLQLFVNEDFGARFVDRENDDAHSCPHLKHHLRQ